MNELQYLIEIEQNHFTKQQNCKAWWLGLRLKIIFDDDPAILKSVVYVKNIQYVWLIYYLTTLAKVKVKSPIHSLNL